MENIGKVLKIREVGDPILNKTSDEVDIENIELTYYDENELLLQKRGSTKKTHPNCWDISGAGHIKTEETVIAGTIRELKEEYKSLFKYIRNINRG